MQLETLKSREPVSSVFVSQSVKSTIYCINPECPNPAFQPWGNKFCNSCGAPLQLNSRYIPMQLLGTGGFAAIYTVWDLQSTTEQVLKVLVEPSPKALELFEQEAAVLASLHHPGVPKVEPDSYFVVNLGSPSHRRLPCLVMEKINGPTLQDILDDHPQGYSEVSVINWLNQAVDILQELHWRKIIHRDIKPSNLMLRRETGQLVAIDFGGAKQIGLVQVGTLKSSTRLISPGYSPPEQIVGGAVGPPADFYALGQTMIHMLTGQYPPDLEDPVTGELRWRNRIKVSSALADLLDRMVQLDVRQRPTSAEEIQAQLAGISSMKTALKSAPASFSPAIASIARGGLKLSWVAIAQLSKVLGTSTLFLLQVITKVVIACLDTALEMLAGGIGAIVGAIVGFWLAYWSPLGVQIATFLARQLPLIVPSISIKAIPAFTLFGLAGLGTAMALSAAGGFGQRKRPFVAGLMGLLSYALGWLVWQATPLGTVGRLLGLIAVAVGPLTLGLGLPSYNLVHAFVATIGTGAVFASLVRLDLLPVGSLFQLFSNASLPTLAFSIAFFSLLGITLAFWLGVSYYLVVPFLRWLGFK